MGRVQHVLLFWFMNFFQNMHATHGNSMVLLLVYHCRKRLKNLIWPSIYICLILNLLH